MRFETLPLECPTGVTEGAPKRVEDLTEKTVIVAGTFVATFDLEVSNDGTAWAKIVTGISAPGAHAIPYTVKSIRTNVTAYTGGSPAVSVAGRNARTE